MTPATITFKGTWTDAEKRRIRDLIDAAHVAMSPARRRRLKGTWLARSTSDPETGRYIAVHRLGIEAALTGSTVEDIARQMRARWRGRQRPSAAPGRQ